MFYIKYIKLTFYELALGITEEKRKAEGRSERTLLIHFLHSS